MVRRVCRELGTKKNIIVLNDEAHHCYRRKPEAEDEKLTGDDRLEAKTREEEARIWISGIEAVRAKIGVKAIYDLSATPFFLRGSGYLQIADATTKKFLFTSRRTGGMISEFKTAFIGAVRDAGLEDFRFHDLRHSFASRLNAAGADPFIIRDLLGHSTTTMSADYTHTSFERRRQAIADMSQSRSHLREPVALDYGKIPEKRDRISA